MTFLSQGVLTDRRTDIRPQNCIPRRFAGGQ